MTTFRWPLAIAWLLLFGCATAQTPSAKLPPAVDVTGTWTGTWSSNIGNIPIEMSLRQVDADVTGNAAISGDAWTVAGYNGAVRGTVSGNIFSFTYPGGGAELTVNAAEMRGTTQSGKSLLMRRQ